MTYTPLGGLLAVGSGSLDPFGGHWHARIQSGGTGVIHQPPLAAQVSALTSLLRNAERDLDYARREAFEYEDMARHYRKLAGSTSPLSASWHYLAEFTDPVTDGWKPPAEPPHPVLRAIGIRPRDPRRIGG